ncbi:MAG: CvpA family protein [Clostridia bacterium]|nr:CvpA family protein [Clostridia bacterium]
MRPIQVDFDAKGAMRGSGVYIPPERKVLKIVISVVVTIIAAGVLYYFMMPAMNPKDMQFYYYFGAVALTYVVATALTSKAFFRPEYVPYLKKQSIVPAVIVGILLVIALIGFISSAALFRSRSYAKLMTVEEQDFSDSVTDIKNITDFNGVPLIDRQAAEVLAGKSLGDLASMGLESQFTVANSYSTQINYHGAPYRVFPLGYGNIFKWLNNVRDGIPGYITVNMNTQVAEFVKVEGGMKYSPAEHFNRLLKRHLRFNYPTYIFGTETLEIDENGTPYWVCEHIDKKVGLFGGNEVVGTVLVDAVTGECRYFTTEECAAGTGNDGTALGWLDGIYDADLLTQQYNYLGKYSNGFFNAYIFQSEVRSTTAGYSYLAMNDDVYMYTGVTSVTTDDSIIGFLLVNQRTKEASFYAQSGTTEAGAQGSAEGIVSDKKWKATFPLLINLDGEATYFMALKDSSNIIKSYAMVNVAQVGDAVRSPGDDDPSVASCLSAYISKLAARDVILNINMTGKVAADEISGDDGGETAELQHVGGEITDIRSSVISGTTYYYVTFSDSDVYYALSAAVYPEAALLDVGDTVELSYAESEGAIVSADIAEQS